MTLATYTADDLRHAKKSGFKKKKPKLRKTGSYNSIMNSVERYNYWVRDLKEASKKGKNLTKLKEQISKHSMRY